MVRHLGFGPFDDQPVANCSVCLLIDGEKKKRSRTHLSRVMVLFLCCTFYYLMIFFFFKLICFLLELLEGKKSKGSTPDWDFFFSCLVPIITLVQRTDGW